MKKQVEADQEDLARDIGALIDGELDENEMLALEKRLFADLSARSLFRGMASDDRLLKQAFLSSGQQVSPELMETIDQGFAELGGMSPNTQSARLHGWWIQAAAAVVLVALTTYSTVLFMDNRLDRTLTAFAAQAEADRKIVGEVLRQALETKKSGQQVNLEDAGASGSVTPVKTYKSVSGHWCREYLRDIVLDRRSIEVRGVACRTSDGEWVTVSAQPDGTFAKGKQGI